MKDIFIGVDGGGTKTKIQIEDQNGAVLGWSKSGPANIRSSVEGAWQSIRTGVAEALQQAKLSLTDPHYRFHIGLALAGTEVPSARNKFLSYPQPYHTLLLKSDAYAACLGVHGGGDGAIIIIGTGVIGYQIENGVESRAGGHGFPHADQGGGAWLGLKAVEKALLALDDPAAETTLTKAVFAEFKNNAEQLVAWANEAKPGDFGQLAPIVIRLAEAQDPEALALLDEAASYIDRLAVALAKKARNPLLPCGLLGGIAPFVASRLAKSLQSRLVPRQHDATKGAVFMIKKHVLGHL